MSAIVLESVLTCPRCGFAKPETMPTDACQFYYECSNCKALLRPNLYFYSLQIYFDLSCI